MALPDNPRLEPALDELIGTALACNAVHMKRLLKEAPEERHWVFVSKATLEEIADIVNSRDLLHVSV